MNFLDDLYEQCSDHSALMTSSSNLLGLRPNFFRKYLFSAFVMPDMVQNTSILVAREASAQ